MSKDVALSQDSNTNFDIQSEISVSKEALEIESQTFDLKHVLKWAISGLSSGLLYQGLLGIGFVSLAVFLGQQEGYTYFWSFISLALSLFISNIFVLILGLFVGTFTDLFGKKKQLVLIFTSISIILFAAIASWLNFYLTIILFIIGNTLFQTSRIIMDAQIPFIAKTKSRGLVIGFNGFFHFLGAVIALLITLIFLFTFGDFTSLSDIQNGLVQFQDIQFGGIRWIFPACAFFMLLSLIPYFYFNEKNKHTTKIIDEEEKQHDRKVINKTFVGMKTGLTDLLKNKQVILFLIGWFFVTSGLTIVTVFLYEVLKRTIHKDVWVIIIVLIVIAVTAALSSIFSGSFLDEIGPKTSFIFNSVFIMIGILLTTIANYISITVTLPDYSIGELVSVTTIATIPWELIFVGAIFIGIALGGFWVIGKQYLMELAPIKRVGQYFGFLNVVNQLGTISGILLFYGLISKLNDTISEVNSYRISLIILLPLFILSIFFLIFVKDIHPRYLVGERAPFSKSKLKLKRESKKINSITKLLYRLQYMFEKFQVILGLIKTVCWLVVLFDLVFDLTISFYVYVIAVVVAIPALTAFVYMFESVGAAWQAAIRKQFDMLNSKMFYDQTVRTTLLRVKAYRYEIEELKIKQENAERKLEIDSVYVEYTFLQEMKKRRKVKSKKE